MKTIPIAFIGGGNMARSLIGGLVADGHDPQKIWVADPDPTHRKTLEELFGVGTTGDNLAALAMTEVVVLAVKPQVMREVARQLTPTVQRLKPLIVSIAAGIREPDLRKWLGGNVAIVRTMPNTPALVRSGATALFANSRVSTRQRELAESILRGVGVAVWVEDEALLDVVTALSGSGPAYFFLIMEAMEQAGIQLGLNPETARLLTLETAFGAAKMALESSESPAALRVRVTSPGGTTERAIAALQAGKLEELFATALTEACRRSRELGDLLGGHS